MAETTSEVPLKLNLQGPSNRQELLAVLNRVIEKAFTMYSKKYTRTRERIAWGRLISTCAKAAGVLLSDLELEVLLKRIEKIEEQIEVKRG